MFHVVYQNKHHTHTRKEASLDAAMTYVHKLARKRTNPFPITILEKGVVAPVVELADRDAYRAYIRDA